MAPAVFTTQHLRHQSFARRYHQAVAGGSHSTDLGKASFRQKISPGSSDKILLILYKHIYIYIYVMYMNVCAHICINYYTYLSSGSNSPKDYQIRSYRTSHLHRRLPRLRLSRARGLRSRLSRPRWFRERARLSRARSLERDRGTRGRLGLLFGKGFCAEGTNRNVQVVFYCRLNPTVLYSLGGMSFSSIPTLACM